MSRPPLLTRWLRALKPPPAVERRRRRLKRSQKVTVRAAVSLLALIAAGYSVYSYITSAPQRAEARFQEGMRQMRPGSYQQAIRSFDRAVSIRPQHALAYFERGVAHKSLGETNAALADFETALGIDPTLAPAYAIRGLIYREQGEVRRAMREFVRSIEIRPTPDAYFQRGQAYDALGEHQKAIEDYDRAIGEIRDAPHIYRARAIARRNVGDIAGYEEDRNTAFAIEHKF
jgi:tetratricopeptide (TPR) repeat protein